MPYPWVVGEQLNATDLNAQFHRGGTGADGALTISSGTTNIDLAGVAIVVKNYTSVAITGTGALTFTNPHANGTLIVFKTTLGFTITSSANPVIDLDGLGGTLTNSGVGLGCKTTGAQTPASATPSVVFITAGGISPLLSIDPQSGRSIALAVGSGGGTGGASSGSHPSGTGNGGAGGRGGGSMYVECLGAYNVTGIIRGRGLAGTNGANSNNTNVNCGGGGWGGGGGGTFVAIYGSLTADSGTYTFTGGARGLTGSVSGSSGHNAGGGAGAGASTIADGGTGVQDGSTGGASGGVGADGIAIRQLNVAYN